MNTERNNSEMKPTVEENEVMTEEKRDDFADLWIDLGGEG